nr:homoserine dehydrogenase [Deltaproteobacteria bacterium]
MNNINIGIIGFGTVGAGVVTILEKNKEIIQDRVGAPVVVRRIADLDTVSDRGITLQPSILTNDARAIINDPEISIVVELIGGEEPAATYLRQAVAQGKHVVTANKALLSRRGEEFFQAAHERGVNIGFEGSVGGGIPIIQAIRDGLSANRITMIFGILNGTSNFILSCMSDGVKDFSEALAEAQRLGYAEADPTLDVSGYDTTHKLSILLSLVYGRQFHPEEIYTEGIARITPQDISFAKELGYRIKLLAISKDDRGEIEVRVTPTLVPAASLISNVQGVYNAVFVTGDAVGSTLFYGRGAGKMPTGSAVVSDIIRIARALHTNPEKPLIPFGSRRPRPVTIKKENQIRSRYYLRFSATDRPGVLSQIAGILGDYDISISSVIQRGRSSEGAVPIFMLIHEALEQNVNAALKKIDELPVTLDRTMLIRIEDTFDVLDC